jgi:cyclic pyranopterin phosphate synthase
MDKPKSETSADVYSSELIRDDVPERLGEFVRRTHFEPETLVVVEAFESGESNESAEGSERLSHYDEAGQAHMVDVGGKSATRREAVAGAFVELSDAVLAALPQNPKGNPLEVARFAGIMAAKKTSDLIPMCHPLALSFVDVQATVVEGGVAILATAATVSGTGVEMEAMVAASVAALTVYDMTKALDKGIRIRDVVLLRKSGGKSGEYRRET